MTDQLPSEGPRAKSETSGKTPASKAVAPVILPAESEPAMSRKLTPEEQMALYEKELKEEDWGHQPC